MFHTDVNDREWSTLPIYFIDLKLSHSQYLQQKNTEFTFLLDLKIN